MTAKQLTDSILQMAIQGKLVPQDPNDEPASVLLERIREEKRRLVKEKVLKKKDLEEVPIQEEEIPFNIPEGWVWCRLSALIQLLSGQDFVPERYNSNHFGIPYITGASNIADGKLIINRWTETPSVIGLRGDLLIVCKGSGVGKMCICNISQIHIARQIQIIRCLSSIMKLDYIKLVIDANIRNIVTKAQGVIPGISRDHILNLLVPLAPIEEQQRIVERIKGILPLVKEYGEAFEEASMMDAELPDKLKKSILQEAIKGKMGTQNSNDEPACDLLEQIREEKKRLVKNGVLKKKDLDESLVSEDEVPFKIPESWEWCRLGGVSYMYTGNSISETEKAEKYTNVVGMNYIGTKDVEFDHSINYNNGIRIPSKFQEKFKKAPSGSVLMCIEGGSAGRKIGILDEEVCFGNKLCCFNPICVNNKYIYYYLQSPTLKDIFKSNMNGIIGGVSISKLSPLIIPIPPLSEQKRIVEKIEALFAEIDNMTINKNDIYETETEEREE